MEKKKRSVIFLFLFFLSLYSFFSIGHFGGDGYEDYLTAESIVLDGNLSLFDRPDDIDEIQYKTDVGVEGTDGGIYSSRGSLGVPVLLSFFYLMGHLASQLLKNVPHDLVTMLAVSFYNPFISALNVLFVFFAAVSLKFERRTALKLSLVFGLATMAPVYARTGFAEPTLVLFLLAGVWLAFMYKNTGRLWLVALSALALAISMFVKVVGVIFIPWIFLYIATRGWTRPPLKKKIISSLIFVSITGAGLACVLFLNFTIYGKLFSSGAYNIADNARRIAGSTHFLKGLYYYIISTGKGMLIFNPVLILAVIPLIKLIRERNAEAVLLFVLVLVNVLFYTKSFRRGSLFSWGPRYLLPGVSLMVLAIGYYVESFRERAAKVFLWILSTAGFIIILPCMLVNQSKFYFFVVEKLGLNEYMINFIPDLSPIKGAWCMLISRASDMAGFGRIPFVYAPDWRLVKPVQAVMEGYDYVDLWFVKVLNAAPDFSLSVYGVLALLAIIGVLSFSRMREIG